MPTYRELLQQVRAEISELDAERARQLIESGELSHSGLDAGAAKIRELNAKIEGAGGAAPTAPAADPSQPPAMPN